MSDLSIGIMGNGQLQRPLGRAAGDDRGEGHTVAGHLARGTRPGDGDFHVRHLVELEVRGSLHFLCEQEVVMRDGRIIKCCQCRVPLRSCKDNRKKE